ncbi:MAG: hypothetical protein HY435_03355 [Candidatus Liptonbacteria bacterium]|nr:hypothetical protein [Candidatus Liptonbacteria bacterium]
MIGQIIFYCFAFVYAALAIVSLVWFLWMIDFHEGVSIFLTEPWSMRVLMLISIFVIVPVFGPFVIVNDTMAWLHSRIEGPHHTLPAA